VLALNVNADDPEIALGELGLVNSGNTVFGDERMISAASQEISGRWPGWRCIQTNYQDHEVLLVNIPPQPRVLVCGAGPDAVPVANQFAELGWDCILADHRPAFARVDRFPQGCTPLLTRPEKLQEATDLQQVDAAIIMAHHLENDAAYLRQLAPLLSSSGQGGNLRYLGVLGPASRRDKLREMAGNPDAFVYGPVGLDIGAELPEAIALSMAAEIHAVLNQRDGKFLTIKATGNE
jgi:xanthine dehydrogenase accessory factor